MADRRLETTGFRLTVARIAALLPVMLLCSAAILLQSCGGSAADGGLTPVADVSAPAGSEAQFSKPPSGPGLPKLPAPSALPRTSSSVEPDFHQNGISCAWNLLPAVNCIGSGSYDLVFEPKPGSADGALGEAAYALYEIKTRSEMNGSKTVYLNWQDEPLHPENIHLGLANQSTDRWDWLALPEDLKPIDLADSYSDYFSSDGTFYAVVVVTGYGSVTLQDILIGEPVFYSRAYASPDHGPSELFTTIYTNLIVDGDDLAYLQFDYLNNGNWASGDWAGAYTFVDPGIYDVQIKATTAMGYTYQTSCQVCVQHPGNKKPIAMLNGYFTNPGEVPLNFHLDGSGSSDPDGSIIKVEWDLDNDGTYELNTGTEFSTDVAVMNHGISTFRMRITDNDFTAAAAKIEADSPAGWDYGTIPGSMQADGYEKISMALVGPDQHPALVYVPTGANKCMFVPAVGPAAQSWDQHYFLNVEPGNNWQPVMTVVDGLPSVAYINTPPDGAPYSLRFTQALNHNGTSWPAESSEIFGGANFAALDLDVVDGKPAAVFTTWDDGWKLRYASSANAGGTQWNAPITLRVKSDEINNFGSPLLVSEPGSRARVFMGIDSGTVPATDVYVAQDLAGTSFSTAQPFWDNFSTGFAYLPHAGQHMFALHGMQPDYNGVNFIELGGLDETDSAYSKVINAESSHGDTIAMASLNNLPIMVYTTTHYYSTGSGGYSDRGLSMQIASTPDALTWGPEIRINGNDDQGGDVNLITLADGSPLMVFSDRKENTLVSARWVQ